MAFVENQVLEMWLNVTTQNTNLSGFIIPILTLLREVKRNGIAKMQGWGK